MMQKTSNLVLLYLTRGYMFGFLGYLKMLSVNSYNESLFKETKIQKEKLKLETSKDDFSEAFTHFIFRIN